mgnify:CR=1 FL=1
MKACFCHGQEHSAELLQEFAEVSQQPHHQHLRSPAACARTHERCAETVLENTTRDDVKLYYNYKIHPDGKFECKMKTRGIPVAEMPWDTLNRMGYSFGGLEKMNYLQKLQNYEQTGNAQAQIP